VKRSALQRLIVLSGGVLFALAGCDAVLPPATEQPLPPDSNLEFLAKQIDAALVNRSRPGGPCEDPSQTGGSSGTSSGDSDAGRYVTSRWTRYCSLPRGQQAAFVRTLESDIVGLLKPSGREHDGGVAGSGAFDPKAVRGERDVSARFVSNVDPRISGWLHVLSFAEEDKLTIVIIVDEYQSRR
jgi:hypothetical protein